MYIRSLLILLAVFLVPQYAFLQTTGYVESEGVNIHYTLIGKGSPILIINGGPGFSSEGFLPMAEKIANLGYQAILYDQRGTGKSVMETRDSSNITMELMNADIESIRKKLGIERWAILGHSFGGMMANYYAAAFPERVSCMIHSSSGGIDLGLFSAAGAGVFSRLSPEDGDSLRYWRTQSQNTPDSEFARKKRNHFMAKAYVFNQEYVPVIAERLEQGDLALNGLVWQDMRRIGFDCKADLREFQSPVLIIQGKDDIIPLELVETAHGVFPHSEIVLLDDCGHYGWLDQEKAYFGAIEAFLKEKSIASDH